jgi:hypothetical protein
MAFFMTRHNLTRKQREVGRLGRIIRLYGRQFYHVPSEFL